MSEPIEVRELVPFINAIYHARLEFDESIVDHVLDLQKIFVQPREISNQGGWHSPVFKPNQELSNISDVEFIVPLLKQIIPIVKIAYNATGINKEAEVDGFWFMINKKHNYNISHNHPGSYFSATFYLKTPVNGGKIVFHRPDKLHEFIDIDKVNDRNSDTYFWDPLKKDLLVFPSFFDHHVEQNLTEEIDDERVCLSINFR